MTLPEVRSQESPVQVSILVPAYNEEASIGETVRRIVATMQPPYVYEILVIDDGSSDSTAKVALEAGAQVIRHPTNGGYGRALKTGMKHAKYDWVAITDADGTYPIEVLPVLIAEVPSFDMVVGARQGNLFWGTLSKRIGRLVMHELVHFVSGVNVPDVNSGMRVFRKDIALRLNARISSGFSFTTTLTLAVLQEGYFVKYLPIQYLPRQGKSHVRYFRDTLRVVQILQQAIVFYNPIKLFLLLALSAILAGTVLGVIGFDLLIFSLGLFTGLLILSIGLLVDAIRINNRSAQ